MSMRRAAEDASCWWSRGAQSPGVQLSALSGFQLQKLPVVQPFYDVQQGGAHYFGQQNVGPEMTQLPFTRPRLRWSKDLHEMFVSAVNQLGGASRATPKTIWNIMQVEGLTLFQIKSHLQKYRLRRRLLRRDIVPADGQRSVEDELPENESVDMEGYQGSCDISDAFVKKMTENPPLFTSVELEKDIEWSELLDGDGINPVSPQLNSLGNSSRSSMMFGSFFDEVAKFSDTNEDDIVMD